MRNAMEIASLGCSVNVRLSEDKKTIDRCRIAYGVAGPVPMRAPSAEAVANGSPLTQAMIDEFALAVIFSGAESRLRLIQSTCLNICAR